MWPAKCLARASKESTVADMAVQSMLTMAKLHGISTMRKSKEQQPTHCMTAADMVCVCGSWVRGLRVCSSHLKDAAVCLKQTACAYGSSSVLQQRVAAQPDLGR
jgi:hypothetical protein